MEPRIERGPTRRESMMAFDESKAVALMLLAALVFLFVIRRGFRGLVVSM